VVTSPLERVQAMLSLLDEEDMTVNLPRLSTYFREDATYQPLAPLARVFRGRDAIVEELGRHAERYHSCRCEIRHAAATERHVFTERTDTVVQNDGGATTVVDVVGVFEVDDAGAIVAWREYWDPVGVARQMNVAAEDILASLGAPAPATA
jgi:limonene-1,2-epoxide hydrolase